MNTQNTIPGIASQTGPTSALIRRVYRHQAMPILFRYTQGSLRMSEQHSARRPDQPQAYIMAKRVAPTLDGVQPLVTDSTDAPALARDMLEIVGAAAAPQPLSQPDAGSGALRWVRSALSRLTGPSVQRSPQQESAENSSAERRESLDAALQDTPSSIVASLQPVGAGGQSAVPANASGMANLHRIASIESRMVQPAAVHPLVMGHPSTTQQFVNPAGSVLSQGRIVQAQFETPAQVQAPRRLTASPSMHALNVLEAGFGEGQFVTRQPVAVSELPVPRTALPVQYIAPPAPTEPVEAVASPAAQSSEGVLPNKSKEAQTWERLKAIARAHERQSAQSDASSDAGQSEPPTTPLAPTAAHVQREATTPAEAGALAAVWSSQSEPAIDATAPEQTATASVTETPQSQTAMIETQAASGQPIQTRLTTATASEDKRPIEQESAWQPMETTQTQQSREQTELYPDREITAAVRDQDIYAATASVSALSDWNDAGDSAAANVGSPPILHPPQEMQQVETMLRSLSPARLTESTVHVIAPRTPRPVQRQRAATSAPNLQSVQQHTPHDLQTASVQTVDTDIGEMPVDLWALIGESPPLAPEASDQHHRPGAPHIAMETSGGAEVAALPSVQREAHFAPAMSGGVEQPRTSASLHTESNAVAGAADSEPTIVPTGNRVYRKVAGVSGAADSEPTIVPYAPDVTHASTRIDRTVQRQTVDVAEAVMRAANGDMQAPIGTFALQEQAVGGQHRSSVTEAPEPDVHALARQVYAQLRRRLINEWERLG